MAHLGSDRIDATSSAHWPVEELDAVDGRNMPEEVDSLASRSAKGAVAVLVWRHTDDQYQTDEQTARVAVEVAGLDASDYTLQHYRIDATHSNAHSVWRDLGSSQDPTEDELSAIKARQGLENFEPVRDVRPDDGTLVLALDLPLPSVSLLVLEPK
jgi:xylan 1,4-beta-xylosidase